MAFERYGNGATTTLGANYTAGSGVLQVLATGGNFPASAQFRVFVADSSTGAVKAILLVTGITDSTHFAVTAEGTDANASTGDIVKESLTAGGMDKIRADLHQTGALASAVSDRAGNLYLPNNALVMLRDTGSVLSPWGPLWPFTDPNLKTWTQQDFGSCTSDTTHGGIDISNPTSQGAFNVHALTTPAPSTPYHVEMGYVQRKQSSGNYMTGACFSDGTKYEIFDPIFQNSLSQAVVFYQSNATTNAGTPVNTNPGASLSSILWVRLGDDGTNKTWDISCDGFNWFQVGSEARATNLTATKIGIYVDSGPSQIRLLSYKETA